METLEFSGLEDGDCIVAVVQQPQLAATDCAFALWCEGLGLVTYGHPDFGGDSAALQDQLKNIRQIRSTRYAFAAILADGSVVTWGTPDFGGDSTVVQDKLQKVQQIHSTERSFAAILADRTVVTWGEPAYGGHSFDVRDQLKNVKQIHSTRYAFAAILADGSVVTWGDPDTGGDSSAVQDQLRDVQQIHGADFAFSAVLKNRNVVTWGMSGFGGDSTGVQDKLANVQQIHSTERSFAAIWGKWSATSSWFPRAPFRAKGRRSLADPAVPMSLAPCMEIWHLFGCTRERLWQHLDGSLRVLPGFFEAMPVPPLIDNGGRSACGSGAVALRTTSATCWTGGLSTALGGWRVVLRASARGA